MICPQTLRECRTPAMCSPYGGCTSAPLDKIAKLEERVMRLERLMEHVCPDKSNET